MIFGIRLNILKYNKFQHKYKTSKKNLHIPSDINKETTYTSKLAKTAYGIIKKLRNEKFCIHIRPSSYQIFFNDIYKFEKKIKVSEVHIINNKQVLKTKHQLSRDSF